MTQYDLRHVLSTNRSNMLNQFNSGTQAEYTERPARLSHHLLRRARAGVGYLNEAIATQKLPLASEWKRSGLILGTYSFSLGVLVICNDIANRC